MSSLLRLLSILCSLVLVVSFAMFVSDQAGDGSKRTVAQIGARDDSQAALSNGAEPKKQHGSIRKAIDGANDKLVGPFKGVIASDSAWVKRISESVLAFLVFGLGLGFVARYASTRGV
jgi:hypothetical protein